MDGEMYIFPRDFADHCHHPMSTVSINLKPIAGFCIKSSTLQHSPNILDVIPIGHKVFVNIAWDPNVPAPPPGSEEVIQRAMEGEDVDELRVNPDGWYVPVIVSEGRPDKDKGALVFSTAGLRFPITSCYALHLGARLWTTH